MSKKRKKLVRARFNDAVFARDNHRCVMCQAPAVDAHHITDRNEMPGGGYVAANGISLCEACHWSAEAFHRGEDVDPGFLPDELYERIGSSHAQALADSERLL